MERKHFEEVQKFDQVWIRILILLTWIPMVALFGAGIWQQIIRGIPWGNNPMSDTGLIVANVAVFLILGATTWLLFTLRLRTEVTDRGVHYRFPPFLPAKRTIAREEIAEYAVRKYNPVREYGGWGFRVGNRKTGKAYNVKGDMGLQLVLKDGRRVLFGTQRPGALQAAMDRMMNPATM